MDCTGVRALLNDYGAGRIDPARQAAVAAHLAGCEACRRALAVESALTAALGRQLPRYPASEALRDRLRHSLGRDVAVEAPVTHAPSPRAPRSRRRRREGLLGRAGGPCRSPARAPRRLWRWWSHA